MSVLRDPLSDLTSDQRSYLIQQRLNELNRVTQLYNLSGVFIFAAATSAILALGHPQLKIAPATWTALLGIECLCWVAADRLVPDAQRQKVAQMRGVIIAGICIACCTWLFDGLFRINGLSVDYFVMCGIALGVSSWGIGAGAIYFGRLVFLFLAVLSLITLMPAIGAKSTNQLSLFMVAFIPNVAASFYFLLERRAHRNLALTEYAASELAVQNEKLKRQAIESEVLIASKVQAAIQAPTGVKIIGSHVIEFFHVPFGLLGGDWLAERELADGRQIIVVADVTGKGIPAAMVVQAVQSLWAASLADTVFDPMRWVQTVNKTLFALGRKDSHTMSMGILVLDDTGLVYYSAGHVPIFILGDIHDHETTRAIHSRGSLLGIAPDIHIEPVKVALTQTEPYCLIIGTDGILDWQTRSNRRAIYDLAHAAMNDGIDAVAKHPVKDDKILVTVKRREIKTHLQVS